MHAKIIVISSSLMLFAQSMPSIPLPDVGIMSSVERITLVGALIIAVAVLWRKVQAQDAQIVTYADQVAKNLQSSIETNRELRQVITELKDKVK